MAQRDRDWPGYTQWQFCPDCSSLWTLCDSGVAAIKRSQLIAAPQASPATPPLRCPVCSGTQEGNAYEI
jgi:hypothetical protein